MKRTLFSAAILFSGVVFSSAFASSASFPPTASDNGTEVFAAAPEKRTAEATTIGLWTVVQSLNTARSRPGAAYFPGNGKFYVLGGEASGSAREIPIEEYDPDTDTWTDRSHLRVGVSNTGAAQVGKLYLRARRLRRFVRAFRDAALQSRH